MRVCAATATESALQPAHGPRDRIRAAQITRRGRRDACARLLCAAARDLVEDCAQVVAHHLNLLITGARFFCERAIKYLLQARRRRFRACLGERLGRGVQDSVAHIHHILALKRPDAREHLVEQDAG